MTSGTSRRRFLQLLGAGAALGATGSISIGAPESTATLNAKFAGSTGAGGFRFVFFPCIHFRPEFGSSEGLARALEAARSLDPKPDFLLTGGDLCQNLRDRSVDDAEKLFDDFLKVLSTAGDLKIHHCIGNHDLAGWSKPQEYGSDSRYGKGLFLKKLKMDHARHSFDHNGWHFVVLDYLKVVKPGEFSPEIDEEQLNWLRNDMKSAAGKPVIVICHAPPVSAVELFTDRAVKDDQQWAVPYGRMVRNTPELLRAVKGSTVAAFVSGHLHMVEDLELLGHRFICSGSVSGHQWTGPRLGITQEGFGVFDCRPDGTLDFHYHDYGWEAKKS